MNALYYVLVSVVATTVAIMAWLLLPMIHETELSASARGLATALQQAQGWRGNAEISVSSVQLCLHRNGTVSGDRECRDGVFATGLLVGRCGHGAAVARFPQGGPYAVGRACYLITPRLTGDALYVYAAYGESGNVWRAHAQHAGRWVIFGREVDVYVVETRAG